MARPALVGLVAVASAATDLITKVIGSALLAGSPVDLPGPLDLRLVHNTGVAFGGGSALPAGAMVAVTAAVAAGVAVLAARGALGSPVAAGLVVDGASANVVDRLVGGSVGGCVRPGLVAHVQRGRRLHHRRRRAPRALGVASPADDLAPLLIRSRRYHRLMPMRSGKGL